MENSQRLIPITFISAPELYVSDNDEGSNGEFELSLRGDQGIFDITPKIVYNEANAMIRVINSSALDYEKIKSITFTVFFFSLNF